MPGRRSGWVISDEDALSMLARIEELIRSSEIQVRHRDVLIRLRSMIEDDLARSRVLRVAEEPAPAKSRVA